MTEPDDNLDHYTLGFSAPGKGIGRDACPYATATEAHRLWIAGYDAAMAADENGANQEG